MTFVGGKQHTKLYETNKVSLPRNIFLTLTTFVSEFLLHTNIPPKDKVMLLQGLHVCYSLQPKLDSSPTLILILSLIPTISDKPVETLYSYRVTTGTKRIPVSYTHLTLPTIYSV